MRSTVALAGLEIYLEVSIDVASERDLRISQAPTAHSSSSQRAIACPTKSCVPDSKPNLVYTSFIEHLLMSSPKESVSVVCQVTSDEAAGWVLKIAIC